MSDGQYARGGAISGIRDVPDWDGLVQPAGLPAVESRGLRRSTPRHRRLICLLNSARITGTSRSEPVAETDSFGLRRLLSKGASDRPGGGAVHPATATLGTGDR
jgi:hypothetical protein